MKRALSPLSCNEIKIYPVASLLSVLRSSIQHRSSKTKTIPGSDPPDLPMLKMHGLKNLKRHKIEQQNRRNQMLNLKTNDPSTNQS